VIIDTHCHLDFEHFKDDRELCIERAKAKGVFYFINIGSSIEGSRKSVELARNHKSIFATVGIHPHHADEISDAVMKEAYELINSERVLAVGEVGLDYFKSPSNPQKQKVLFEKFIRIAKEKLLPLVVHNREASSDTLEILKTNYGIPVKGVMHCFSGGKDFLKKVLDMGLFVSFTCNLTFKNAKKLREVAQYVPKERLLLETDAPFLAPQKFRGKRNEPAFITELRDILSELLKTPKEEIERITTDNAKTLFNLNST